MAQFLLGQQHWPVSPKKESRKDFLKQNSEFSKGVAAWLCGELGCPILEGSESQAEMFALNGE